MFSLLKTCCESFIDLENEQLLYPNTYTNSNIPLHSYLFQYLDNKIGYCVIYSNDINLILFNDLKNDKTMGTILKEHFKEIYKKKNEKLALDLINELHLDFNEFVVIIFGVIEDKIKIFGSLKDGSINLFSLKKLILANQYSQKKIPSEPDGNKDKYTTIIIRGVNGKGSVQRKFKLNEKVEAVYSFVKSKASSFFDTNNLNLSFKLIRVFPHKKFDNLNNTLEMEGLYPSATLQIECPFNG